MELIRNSTVTLPHDLARMGRRVGGQTFHGLDAVASWGAYEVPLVAAWTGPVVTVYMGVESEPREHTIYAAPDGSLWWEPNMVHGFRRWPGAVPVHGEVPRIKENYDMYQGTGGGGVRL